MIQNKVLSLIGLAIKSGNIASGSFATEKAVKDGKARIVIAAGDVSDNTRERYINMCSARNVPIYFYGTKDELGHAIGKEFRAAMAVTDKGLADLITENINGEVM